MHIPLFVLMVCICCAADMFMFFPKEAAAKYNSSCLDGTPAAYYFQAGSVHNHSKWVIHLQGNGWCFTPESCLERSKTPSGCSGYAPSYIIYGGPLFDNDFYNPHFWDWNHAMVLGCDGGSFLGNRDEPLIVDGEPVYFRGRANVLAAIQDLLDKHSLGDATEVIFSGDFDGGLGAIVLANEVRAMLPKTLSRFKVIPMSGIILDHPNFEGKDVFPSQIKDFFDMANCSGSLEPQCLASFPKDQQYKCMFAENTLKYVTPPMFMIGSAYDTFATQCVIGAEPITGPSGGEGNCSAVPGWAKCEKYEDECTSDQWSAIQEYGEKYEKIVESNPVFSVPGNGMFEYTCHKFTAELGFQWYLLSINGTKMRDAVVTWFYSDNEPAEKFSFKGCKNQGDYCCNVECCLPDDDDTQPFMKEPNKKKH